MDNTDRALEDGIRPCVHPATNGPDPLPPPE